MAAAPAYAHDYAARPARRHESRHTSRPDVRVVRGQKSNTLSGVNLVTVAKVGLVVLLVCMALAFIRISILSASYSVASQASTLRAEITEMQTESSSLDVQKSLMASPTNLRNTATNELKMSAPEEVTTIKLSEDVVKTDADGNLSLSASLAAVGAQD